MTAAVSSLEYRKKKGQLDGLNVVRVGLLKDNRSVFMLKDIGYWICPPYVTFSTNGKGILRLTYQYRDGHRQIWNIAKWSRSAFMDVASRCLRACYDDGYLFSKRIRRTFFNAIPVSKVNKVMTITIPKALHSYYDNHCNYIQLRRRVDEPYRRFSERVQQVHAKLVWLFKMRYRITIDEALTFYPNNPILYEL